MSWLIGLEHFRSSLKIGPGGETGPVNDIVRHTSERIGTGKVPPLKRLPADLNRRDS